MATTIWSRYSLQQKSDTSRVTEEAVLLLPALLSPKPVPRTRVSTFVLPSRGTSPVLTFFAVASGGACFGCARVGLFGSGRLIAGGSLGAGGGGTGLTGSCGATGAWTAWPPICV